MCKILFKNENYEQLKVLSERVLAIDPQNQEAKNYIREVNLAKSNS
jgi:hypothetical protein